MGKNLQKNNTVTVLPSNLSIDTGMVLQELIEEEFNTEIQLLKEATLQPRKVLVQSLLDTIAAQHIPV
jgi:hypothetical protein